MAEGIILGAVAGELLKMILEMKDKAVQFKEQLECLEKTLEHVTPLFEEGRKLLLQLNDRNPKALEEMTQKLQNGKELLRKCGKVPAWKLHKRIIYSSRIISLDQEILRFCQRELQVEIWRDNKELLWIIQQLEMKLDKLTLQQRETLNNGLFAVPGLPDLVVGFDVALEELKSELFKENVMALGLYAPGGCGKSTLAKMLCRDEQVKGIFKDNILFITVSRMLTSTSAPTLEILHKVIERIGGGTGVPLSSLSEENAINQFHCLLEKRKSEPLLLVLDDVWHESIIEKFFSRTEGYKMLVTSREKFNTYNSRHYSKYLLKPLGLRDSMTLFREIALSEDGNEGYEPNEDLLNKIVRSCGGFPLAVRVIAKSLCQQPAMIWENLANKLLKGGSVFDFGEKELQECLEASLDSLDKNARECFLDLGSFPKDKRIPVSALIDIWCELYKLDYESEAFAFLLILESRNLVNLVGSRKYKKEIDASLNELFVTQHELLNDLAIFQNRKQSERLVMNEREISLPESWKEKEIHYLNAHLVSLHTGEMCVESWYDLQLSEVEGLILNLSASSYALPPFIKKMRKLKLLIVVNGGRTKAKLDNLIALGECANLKRIRLEKVSIPSLHEFPMSLMNLRKISLVMCDLDQALLKCTIKGSDVLPNLVEINIDYCYGLLELPPWICDLIMLQTLNVTNCDNLSAQPERIGDLTDLDLLRLHGCTGLSMLPDSIQGLQKLRFLDISDCCNLKMLPDGMGELHCLKKLDMRGCIELSELPPSAMNLFQLKEVICDDEDKASLWKPLSPSLKISVLKKDYNLDWLAIDICDY